MNRPVAIALVVGTLTLGVPFAPLAAATPRSTVANANPRPSEPARGDAAARSTVDGPDNSVRVLLIPALDTVLSSPVAGRIRSIESELGATFPAGRLLVAFDCDEPTARLAMARAESAGARETHEAKVRMKGLDQASDVEVALAAAAAAKARAQVALGEAQVSQCSVRAPWAGRVAKIHARNFMSVNAGQPLLDLVKTGPLKLKLSVPSRDLAKMKPGATFTVAIDETGRSYQARVTAQNSRIDPVSQTIEIEADMVEGYPDLLAGMSGTARLPVAR